MFRSVFGSFRGVLARFQVYMGPLICFEGRFVTGDADVLSLTAVSQMSLDYTLPIRGVDDIH
jgi:hypothetical protein